VTGKLTVKVRPVALRSINFERLIAHRLVDAQCRRPTTGAKAISRGRIEFAYQRNS